MKTWRVHFLSIALIAPGAAAWFLGFLVLGGGLPGVRIAQADVFHAFMYCAPGSGTPCPSAPCSSGYYCDSAPIPAQCWGPALTGCQTTTAQFGSCGGALACSDGQPVLVDGKQVKCPEVPSSCKTVGGG